MRLKLVPFRTVTFSDTAIESIRAFLRTKGLSGSNADVQVFVEYALKNPEKIDDIAQILTTSRQALTRIGTLAMEAGSGSHAMEFGGKIWVPLNPKAMDKMEVALIRMKKEFERAGGTFNWEPHNVKYQEGKRILGSFDNTTTKGQPIINIFQGGNRGTMAHELFHSRPYASRGRLGDGTVLGGTDPRIRAAIEADVYSWLHSLGWGAVEVTDIIR
jgi:hypothetical protein